LLKISDAWSNADERYRLLIDSIVDYAIFMLDKEGNVSSWNAGAERINGYRESEAVGRHFSCFYRPVDRQAGLPQSALATATEDGRFETEGWRLRKDGSQFWAHDVIDPILDPSGVLLGFAEIIRDLSERRAAEEELRKSEQQFRLLVRGVTDYAIYMMDPEGYVTSWNAGAERIKGYREEEIIGQHFSRFFPIEDKENATPRKALEEAAKVGRFESEGWRVRKDGTRFWANAVLDALKDESGRLIGFAKITRDVTEKRDAQEALDLAREELFQAQKMEAVGQLTGGVAHDFNNLLMAIQGSLELLKKRIPHSTDTVPLIENALQATQRGASLTQRMLAFSRRQELQLEAVDVVELIRGMTDMLQRSLGPTVIVETHFPLQLPKVCTDPNQLANAILNLAINARDAMPRGGTLTVGARVVADAMQRHSDLGPGEFVCLFVQDSGEGMDEETLANATTPFFTTKGIGKGTGLGLPMVQGLMGQSRGKLVLHSKAGEGTTAELWLPVSTPEHMPAPPEPAIEISPEQKRLTVLAVDDDPLVLMNTVFMLEDMGHTVVEANSGSQALSLLEERPVDMVITDQAMPRMTGLDLTKAIRQRWPRIPVIIATGYAELPAGAGQDVVKLSKPFMERQLADSIQKVLSSEYALA
jgi:PAS domain S-box-containing protein